MGFINKQTLSKVVYVVPIIFILLSIYILLNNKKEEIKLDDVIVKENISNKKGFAIMLQDEAGSDSYTPSESATFPTEGYTFNSEKSGCMDERGYKIENALNYDNTNQKVMVSVKGEAYCYVYFDVAPSEMTGLELVASHPTNLSTSQVGGLYRYQGTHDVVNNNYICFGTDNAETCKNDTDHYMYRIIGVNPSGQIKVIKKEALNDAYLWHDSSLAYNIQENNNNVTLLQGNAKNKVKLLKIIEPGMEEAPDWPDSSLYRQINGSAYLNDTNYVPTTPINWQNKIASFTWKYGSADNNIYNGDTYYSTYTGWSDTTNYKISLMYPHDYIYAYGTTAPGTYQNAKNAWINLAWNDDGTLADEYEWLNTSSSSDSHCALSVQYHTGNVGDVLVSESYQMVRPVFYLESSVKISGEGTTSSPYVIVE